MQGLIDLRSTLDGFAIEDSTDTKKQLFFNTGKMQANQDVTEEMTMQGVSEQLKFNEFVVFDPAQVKIKYAVMCDFFKAN